MNAITFAIELLQPMLATGLEGDPNAGVSLPYVPGSVLRGAVIGLFLQDNSQTDLAVAERDLFFNEKVCFLNAYPLVEIPSNPIPKRSLPIPFSWHKEKDQTEDVGAGFYDFARTKNELENPKGLAAKFFAFKDATSINVIKAELKTRISVHTRRNPAKGRATDEDGDVFRYESIETGTKFGGAIISESLGLLKRIKALLENNEISVGGSRTGGYGRARIQTVTEKTDWQETDRISVSETKDKEIQGGQSFTITLLSNALVRDKNGQLQSEMLAETLGLIEGDIELIKKETYKKAELIGGFNRKWGLPLPQQISIKAGSVFTFKANKRIEKSRIEEWLNNGIGERHLYGFGRIAVNLHNHTNLMFAKADPKKLSAAALSSTYGVKAGQTIVNRLLRHKFESRLIEYIGENSMHNAPKNSQISRLRLLVREILRTKTTIAEAKDEFKKFFDNLKSTARDQFERARIKNLRTKDWIISYLKDDSLFNDESIELGDDKNNVVSSRGELQFEFRLKLIDGVLERAVKDKRRTGNE